MQLTISQCFCTSRGSCGRKESNLLLRAPTAFTFNSGGLSHLAPAYQAQALTVYITKVSPGSKSSLLPVQSPVEGKQSASLGDGPVSFPHRSAGQGSARGAAGPSPQPRPGGGASRRPPRPLAANPSLPIYSVATAGRHLAL